MKAMEIAGLCAGVMCWTVLVSACEGKTPESGMELTCTSGEACDDEDPCTENDKCDPQGACVGTPISCDDDRPCTNDSCGADGKCIHELQAGSCLIDGVCREDGESPEGEPCKECMTAASTSAWTSDDTNACGQDDKCQAGAHCAAGSCVPGDQVVDCNDDNPCTDDSCDPASGCTNEPNTASCDGGICVNGECKCAPDCKDKECGDDGCGGTCGECGDLEDCTEAGVCECLFLDCAGVCCTDAAVCNEEVCCTPDCTGKECGDDGCSGTCGACGDLEACSDLGVCECLFVECAGACCAENTTCVDDNCCAPDCSGKECGDDGCNGSCGVCGNLEVCSEVGLCVCEFTECAGSCCDAGMVCADSGCCSPDCADKECGDDGCGGTCGSCFDDETCQAGQCLFESLDCDGDGVAECPELPGYVMSCNPQQHCEYGNPDTSGWKKWDVWIWIPPGTTALGSPVGEVGHASAEEDPAGPNKMHPVTFAKGYFIGKYEIVVAQYEACKAANPGKCTPADTTDWAGAQGTNTSGNGKGEHPQNGLTWQQAKNFCAWVAPGGRLPSEAEWEYAAKGPVHRKYPWGDNPEPTCSNNTAVFNEAGNAAGYGCGQGAAWEAGSKTAGASWSGALDMSGNLWEWCEDWYHSNFQGAPGDGSAWVDPTGSNSNRVVRSAGFNHDASFMRSAKRSNNTPGYRNATYGARCVRPDPNCQPVCAGKSCGADGCGGSCGDCLGPQESCIAGACVCQPACEGMECGDDGCGGTCGDCAVGDLCSNNLCLPTAAIWFDGKTYLKQPQFGIKGAKTYSLWFYALDVQKDQVLLIKKDTPGDATEPRPVKMWLMDGVLTMRTLYKGKPGEQIVASTPVQASTWHHVAFQVSEVKAELFLDGTMVDESIIPNAAIDNDQGYTIGAAPGVVDYVEHFVGYMYNLSVTPGFVYSDSFDPCEVDPLSVDSLLLDGTGPVPCACTPQCKDKECGDDGCGGSCGDCGAGECDPEMLVCVPEGWALAHAGSFQMGIPNNQMCGPGTATPVHEVVLTRSFYVKNTEVTQAEWTSLMGTSPFFFKSCGADCPAEYITWFDALNYCNKLSQKEGLEPCYDLGEGGAVWTKGLDCEGYRLPTEAEWEYSARAGTATAYYNGEFTGCTPCTPAPVLDKIGWYCGNSAVTYGQCVDASANGGPSCTGTHPVAQKLPNAWGLYDTAGNVYEWCWDWYGETYYSVSPKVDPLGPATGEKRVLRGGSAPHSVSMALPGYHVGYFPDVPTATDGFRPVRTVK